jgi:hypothetical protein
MKKILFALLFAVPAVGFAQDATQSVTVNAAINNAITLSKISDLSFGNVANVAADAVVASADNELTNASGGRAQILVTQGQGAMSFTISGAGFNENVIQLSPIAGGVSEDDLAVTLNYAFGSASGSASVYALGDSVTPTYVEGDPTSSLFIGGTIASSAMTGKAGTSYTGTITVTATYF